jgi:uncharacterized membrane protein HdeD (DUF308 family)
MSAQMTQPPPSHAVPYYRTSGPVAEEIRESFHQLRASWWCFVTLGAALVLLGMLAMSYSVATTIATALVFGFFLVAAGAFYIVGAFFTHRWGGFFLSLLAGILNLAVGVVVLDRPGEAVMIYTLLMAVFFFIEGLFWIFGSLTGRFQHWGWAMFFGIATLALGVMIWRQWPLSGLYVVGLFLGINLIISGISYIGLGFCARKLPD